jgi:hypothetical protein
MAMARGVRVGADLPVRALRVEAARAERDLIRRRVRVGRIRHAVVHALHAVRALRVREIARVARADAPADAPILVVVALARAVHALRVAAHRKNGDEAVGGRSTIGGRDARLAGRHPAAVVFVQRERYGAGGPVRGRPVLRAGERARLEDDTTAEERDLAKATG